MRTVKEVSKLTGVSIRTLQYYDKIGLLHPTLRTEAGYSLYEDADLELLQQILLFRELEFSLKEIKEILSSPAFDKNKALSQQIELLTLKKEHLENLIQFAREIQSTGGEIMSFKAFDTSKIEEYAKQAKEQWGHTVEYKEYEEKSKNRSKEEYNTIRDDFVKLYKTFGEMKTMNPESAEVQNQVKKLHDYISENLYSCSMDRLLSLGEMYSENEEFTRNIDHVGGIGTAGFVTEAIRVYCEKNR